MELLVVIVILSMLVALVMAGLSSGRGKAQSILCVNHLREIGLTTQVYVSKHDAYPRAWVGSDRRWMDLLKPYLDKKCEVYQCPADAQKIPVAWDPDIILSYGINTFNFKDAAHCFWYTVKEFDVRHPKDVILFADCTPGKYYCGGGNKFLLPVPAVDYQHPGGTFNVVYCDGHAETKFETNQREWDASQ